jgi:hypothetical protein
MRTNITNLLRVLSSAAALCIAGSAHSQTVAYNQTFTGAQLAAAPGVQFYHRPTSVSGSSLDFGTGNSGWNQMMVLPLLPAGALTSATDVVVNVAWNRSRMTADNDSGFMLSDGSGNFIGMLVGDNENGHGYFWRLTDADNDHRGEAQQTESLFSNAGFPAVGAPFSGSLSFTLGAAGTLVSGGFGSGSGSYNTIALNRTGPLSLSYFGDDAPEMYRINSLSVQVTGTQAVPEPGTWAALAGITSVGGLALLRRLRTARAQ